MENIVIIDCGSQFTQLIARRIREMHVHSEIIPAGCTLDEVKSRQPKGLIISGGPKSVLDQGSPRVPDGFFYLGVPILGVCYGMQLMARLFGGVVRRSKARSTAEDMSAFRTNRAPSSPACPTRSKCG